MWERLKRWFGISPEPVAEKVTKIPTSPAGGFPTAPQSPSSPPQHSSPPVDEEEMPHLYEEDDGSGDTLQELYDMEEPDWTHLDPLNQEEDDEGLPPVHIAERDNEYQSEHPLPGSDVDDSFWDLAATDEPHPYREITGELPYSGHEVYAREEPPAPPSPNRDFLEDYEREAAEEKGGSVFGESDLAESNFAIPLDDEELPADLYAGDYFDSQDRKNLRQDPSTAEG